MRYYRNHIVDISIWPILVTFNILSLILSIFNDNNITIRIILFIISIIYWCYDIYIENIKGDHTIIVNKGIYIGLGLFIISEIAAFFSLFFSYFYNSLIPDILLGSNWPPLGISHYLNYDSIISIPLFNTLLLISSGFTITSLHNYYHYIHKSSTFIIGSLYLLTISLGILFICLQAYEYYEAIFTYTDSIYGSLFYSLTGFHGIHIILGTILLILSYFTSFFSHTASLYIKTINALHTITIADNKLFFFSAIYWHFVDIIWLFLFYFLYYFSL